MQMRYTCLKVGMLNTSKSILHCDFMHLHSAKNKLKSISTAPFSTNRHLVADCSTCERRLIILIRLTYCMFQKRIKMSLIHVFG